MTSGIYSLTSGSLSPRSHGSSYPQTPPNSYSVDSAFSRFSVPPSTGATLLDTQELLSKLDNNLTVEDDGEENVVSENIEQDGLEGDQVERNRGTLPELDNDDDLGRIGYDRTDLPGTEEAFELFRKQNEEFIQHMDSIVDADEELTSNEIPTEVTKAQPGVNINVDDYLFDLHNENVVASNLCQEMIADGVDSSKYHAYISELPNSREEYHKMVTKFVKHQTFHTSRLNHLRSQALRGTSTKGAQECITDPLTTAMLTASLGHNSSETGKPRIEPQTRNTKRQIVDFEIPRFMPTDIDYREPLLASQRECQERNRYLKLVQPTPKINQPKTRLIPSESEQNIKLFDEWQDDEISDLAKNSSVLFSDSEDVDVDEMRETFAEQKRRLEEEYGIDLEDSQIAHTAGASGGYEFEWDDQELGGGFGGVDDVRRDSSVNEDLFDDKLIDTSINIQATRRWRVTYINGAEKRIDMKVLDPFKKVLSHGGFTHTGQMILVFSACYMPEKKRPDYKYILENLFLYVISSIQLLITGDYVLVYLHGGADDSVTPSLNWLKKCFSHIDHRVRKHLQALYLVHPDFWVKTGMKLAKVRSGRGIRNAFPYIPHSLPHALTFKHKRINHETGRLRCFMSFCFYCVKRGLYLIYQCSATVSDFYGMMGRSHFDTPLPKLSAHKMYSPIPQLLS